jgi:hypothetical protein
MAKATTTTTTTTTNALFETEPCSRCGGSGHYSRCQMYGTTCFRCSGRGVTLTKRGTLAQAYYRTLCSRPAREIHPGMRIYVEGAKGARTVIWSGTKPQSTGGCWAGGVFQPFYILEVEGTTLGTSADTRYRVVQTKAEQASKQAEALAYQATLTKAGKPLRARA